MASTTQTACALDVTIRCARPAVARGCQGLAWPMRLLLAWFRAVQKRREALRAITHLRELDDRALRDVGLTRADIDHAVMRGRALY